MLEPVVRRCGLPFLRGAKQMPDDLKDYKQDAFSLIDSETAGAIIGGLVAALVVCDVLARLIEKI